MPPVLAGDYNNNNIVDAGDYVVWRDNEGTNNTLPNNPIAGPIGLAHYNQWAANFGKTAGSGSVLATSTTVPEPASILLVLAAALGVFGLRRRV